MKYNYLLCAIALLVSQAAFGMQALAEKQQAVMKEAARNEAQLTPEQIMAREKAKFIELLNDLEKGVEELEKVRFQEVKAAYENPDAPIDTSKADAIEKNLIDALKQKMSGMQCQSLEDFRTQQLCYELRKSLSIPAAHRRLSAIGGGQFQARMGGAQSKIINNVYKQEFERLFGNNPTPAEVIRTLKSMHDYALTKIKGKPSAAMAQQYLLSLFKFGLRKDDYNDVDIRRYINSFTFDVEDLKSKESWITRPGIVALIKDYAQATVKVQELAYEACRRESPTAIADNRTAHLNLDRVMNGVKNSIYHELGIFYIPNENNEFLEASRIEVDKIYQEKAASIQRANLSQEVTAMRNSAMQDNVLIENAINSKNRDFIWGVMILKEDAIAYVNNMLNAIQKRFADVSGSLNMAPIEYKKDTWLAEIRQQKEQKEKENTLRERERAERERKEQEERAQAERERIERLQKEQKEAQQKANNERDRNQMTAALKIYIDVKLSSIVQQTYAMRRNAWLGKARDPNALNQLNALYKDVLQVVPNALNELKTAVEKTGVPYDDYLKKEGLSDLISVQGSKLAFGSALNRKADAEYDNLLLLNELPGVAKLLANSKPMINKLDSLITLMTNRVSVLAPHFIDSAIDYEAAYNYGRGWVLCLERKAREYIAQAGYPYPEGYGNWKILTELIRATTRAYELAKELREKRGQRSSGSSSSSQQGGGASSQQQGGARPGPQPNAGLQQQKGWSSEQFERAVQGITDVINEIEPQRSAINNKIQDISITLEGEQKAKADIEKRIMKEANPQVRAQLQERLTTLDKKQPDLEILIAQRESLKKELEGLDEKRKQKAVIVVDMINKVDRRSLATFIKSKGKAYKNKLLGYIHPDKLGNAGALEATKIITGIEM